MNLLQLLNSLNTIQGIARQEGAMKALRSFIFSDLPEILNQLNDGPWKAAELALVNNPLSNQDTDRVARAITHLAAAYVMACKSAERLRSDPEVRRLAYEQACEAAILIAFCQRYLQQWSEVRRYANIARVNFVSYKEVAREPVRPSEMGGDGRLADEKAFFAVPYIAEKEKALQQFLNEVCVPF